MKQYENFRKEEYNKKIKQYYGTDFITKQFKQYYGTDFITKQFKQKTLKNFITDEQNIKTKLAAQKFLTNFNNIKKGIINERLINELPFIITTNYDKVHEIFGNKLISLKAKSFFEEYYIKENNIYTYIFYMPFANFYLIDYLNYLTTNDLHSDIKVRVLCFDYSVEYIRKYLNEKIEVNCIYHKHR